MQVGLLALAMAPCDTTMVQCDGCTWQWIDAAAHGMCVMYCRDADNSAAETQKDLHGRRLRIAGYKSRMQYIMDYTRRREVAVPAKRKVEPGMEPHALVAKLNKGQLPYTDVTKNGRSKWQLLDAALSRAWNAVGRYF